MADNKKKTVTDSRGNLYQAGTINHSSSSLESKRENSRKKEIIRKKKISDAKANAGKPGYDRYGAPLKATRIKLKGDELLKKRKKHDDEVEVTTKKQVADKKQADKVKKNINKPSSVDQTSLIKKRSTQTNKGSNVSDADGLKNYLANRKKKTGPKRVSKKRIAQVEAKVGGDGADLKELKNVQKKKYGNRSKSKPESAKDKYRREAFAKKDDGKKTSRSQKRQKKREDRTDKIRQKGLSYKEGDKKGERLLKRAKRRGERDRGTRRSAVSTAAHKVGRAALGVAGALGGGGVSGLIKGGTKGSFYKNAAHVKKKKK